MESSSEMKQEPYRQGAYRTEAQRVGPPGAKYETYQRRFWKDWGYTSRPGKWEDFTNTAPFTHVSAPEWPPRATVEGRAEMDLGRSLSDIDAKLAYDVWKKADDLLETAWRRSGNRGSPNANAEEPARNVYEHLLCFGDLPVAYKNAKVDFEGQGLTQKFDTESMVQAVYEDIIEDSPLRGITKWSEEAIRAEIAERQLPGAGTTLYQLREELIMDELNEHCGVMPTGGNLLNGNIESDKRYLLQPAEKSDMTVLDMYTFAIHLSPYNPTYWVSRAYCHYQQGYFDLAIGDAYKAQILCNTVEQMEDRREVDGLYSMIWGSLEKHVLADPKDDNNHWREQVMRMRQHQGINGFISLMQFCLLNIICLSLMAMNCWDDYESYHRQLSTRFERRHIDIFFADVRKETSRKARKAWRKKKKQHGVFWQEKHAGAISAQEKYPYEEGDAVDLYPDRQKFLQLLSEEVFQHKGEGLTVPSDVCQAGFTPETHGIGVIAKRTIKKGELIHFEEPVIRSHLAPMRLDKDQEDDMMPRCENCHIVTDPTENRTSIITWSDISDARNVPVECACHLYNLNRYGGPMGLHFCPSDRHNPCCQEIASKLYHFDTCGRSWYWLHNCMRLETWWWGDKQYFSHSNEVHGTYLSLLMRSVIEITLKRRLVEETDLSPHQISELLILDGNSMTWRDSWFPFTMAANIIVPFDILKYMGVNIFRDLSFDTWTLQIVLRKLLANAVPWDLRRRDDHDIITTWDESKRMPTPREQEKRLNKNQSFRMLDPAFEDLYLFPGLSLFNHACDTKNNADWGYDEGIPNRVLVWATKDIQAGEEIKIRYQHDPLEAKDAERLFGSNCQCGHSKHDNPPERSDEEPSSDEDGKDTEKDKKKDKEDIQGTQGQGQSSGQGDSQQFEPAPATSSGHVQHIEHAAAPAGQPKETKTLVLRAKRKASDIGDDSDVDDDSTGDDDPPRRVTYVDEHENEKTYTEKVTVVDGRHVITRLLAHDEEMDDQYKRRKAGSAHVFVSMDEHHRAVRRNNYIPRTRQKAAEDNATWLKRERELLKAEREAARERIKEKQKINNMKIRTYKVPRIAREIGEEITTQTMAEPIYVDGLDRRPEVRPYMKDKARIEKEWREAAQDVGTLAHANQLKAFAAAKQMAAQQHAQTQAKGQDPLGGTRKSPSRQSTNLPVSNRGVRRVVLVFDYFKIVCQLSIIAVFESYFEF
ncbi:hypothetical protein N7532_011204 [Penicillium argentinense]|uniref:Histone-lysine N-methyltransferase SET5 n=1 Tax=Penicillium argentinense TaxID=1131581 RepID=A0A9W9EI02_9EURO|nr:uncharacterized protein N7532_011204 [Penicillium argentinense]KAJ5082161.1 hypothetical protein N7532_011204 [Penicillium argentinense]